MQIPWMVYTAGYGLETGGGLADPILMPQGIEPAWLGRFVGSKPQTGLGPGRSGAQTGWGAGPSRVPGMLGGRHGLKRLPANKF